MTEHMAGTLGAPRIDVRRIEGIAWGVFFIWVGIALLAEFSWAVSLLGVGLLTLAGQLARRVMGAALEPFWVVVGAFFVMGSVWLMLDVRVSLIPICSIVAGLALLVSALVARTARK